ncbi:Guanosine-5'-triphosphate,3'-diphosphate pyrophosphatase [Cinnamomum micranthum f. kanehirae]|uniref:Guanosine-5'-triphosphate,3'-diphosphate pyrophosphatase n=1 Tax=Cinnamomum micranthum f. kanehirae TaxID=337451 RepID=A0A443NGC1_9MAGN|nr:Guanosine-5'-triphosphate,3'-diphosphate pyrophosphatase [Cinnamomum micranthum f. kanehirae]
MSFLAGRSAAAEGAYFLQESKQAVERLSRKYPSSSSSSPSIPTKTHSSEAQTADVLHEVLRHSIPINPSHHHPQSSLPSLSTSSKWRPSSSSSSSSSHPSVSSDAVNPLRAYVSMPQVTFGPKRWQLPNEEHAVLASTANELRRDRHTHVDSRKLKAAAEGLSQIGKAFAIASTIVFGGATVAFMLTASKLQLHNSDDIKTKGRDLFHPRLEMIREQVGPLRDWAEQNSRKWHFEREEEAKEKPAIIKEISKQFGVRTTN